MEESLLKLTSMKKTHILTKPLIYISLLSIFYSILLNSCSQNSSQNNENIITVSIVPQKYFLEKIAGDAFTINVMVPAGSSPETYEPNSLQMRQIAKSKLYFKIGHLDFEKASIFRDRIKSLNIIQSSQRVNEANLIEADVIAAYKESGKTCIQVFFYRAKQNWGNQSYLSILVQVLVRFSFPHLPDKRNRICRYRNQLPIFVF